MTPLLPDDTLAERIRECLLELLIARGPGRSICPSEVARMLGQHLACRWQDLMRPVRTVVAALAEIGIVEATQHQGVVNILDVRGPVRLRLRSLGAPRQSHDAA